jgi:hypothetical protein
MRVGAKSMATKVWQTKAADYVMDLFGIDKRLVKDITFSFPLHGAAQVTIVRLLSAEEEEHAKRLMDPDSADLRTRDSSHIAADGFVAGKRNA